MSYGIDISNNNATVDWYGVQFCFIKATESTSFIDRKAPGFILYAETHGILWSPYHFSHPDVNSAAAEAAFFLAHSSKGSIAPVLDFETRRGVNPLALMGATRATQWIDEFCDRILQARQQAPFFYTFRSYADTLYPRINPAWPLWLANGKGVPTYKSYAGRLISVEQYASTGGLDRNISYVDLTTTPAPPIPQPPQGDDEVVFLVIGDSDPQFFTNWIHKWHTDAATRDTIIAIAAFKGHPIVTEPNQAPIRVPQSALDAIPLANPTTSGGGGTPYHLQGTGSISIDIHPVP